MKPTPQEIRSARRIRLSSQSQLLYETDRYGNRVYDDEGEQIWDLGRAPVVLEAVGVPRTLCQATFAGSQFTEIDRVRDWYVDSLADGVGGEYLSVLIGDATNYTAAAVLRNAVKHGLTVAWYDWNTFTQRYTDNIIRDRLITHGNAEESASASSEVYTAEDEDFHIRYVYEVLAIVEFNIDDVRDFAVPDICAIFRHRTSAGLITVVTVPTANGGQMRESASSFGERGALLRLFEHESVVFDGRQRHR